MQNLTNIKKILGRFLLQLALIIWQNFSLENKKKEAEVRLALFITEHNISSRTSDHLVQLVKVLAPESEVSKNVSCNCTKATSIVENVVGNYVAWFPEK